jgi:transcriptional regulator with XRE-family HTH domain
MEALATKANVSPSTIRDFEAGRRAPHRNRLTQIRQALEIEGFVFVGGPDDDTSGITKKAPVSHADAPKVEKEVQRVPASRKSRSTGAKRKS